ncbi:MAG: ABC transporter permease [Bacteroidales bacterium]
MIKILSQSIYYQFIIFLRIKQAVFFTVTFPIFLFVIFTSIWGTQDNEYVSFLLSGIVGMTIASDGMFAIGPVIKEYYSNGLIKYLRKLPFNILLHFVGLIISRIITLLFIVFLLCISAYFIFGYAVTSLEIINFVFGVFTGLFVFSFLGLVIIFSGIKQGTDKGIINFIYFIILFTSNAFYPVGDFNQLIGYVGNALPLNQILCIMRGDGVNYTLAIWIVGLMLLFVYLFKNVKFNR